jgi:adenylosuccinate synthase
MVDVLLGLQWGDEGKGKIADFLTPGYDVVARFQGGPNAGHSLEMNGKKHVLNTIPSGIFHESCISLIGNGVVIDPILLKAEIEKTIAAGADVKERLLISRKAHLILPSHRLLDAASEQYKGAAKIGSTLRGISPTYQDKTGRSGLRIGDTESPEFEKLYRQTLDRHLAIFRHYDFEYEQQLRELESQWFEALQYLEGFKRVNSEFFLHSKIKEGKKILAEGAQGSLLDLDFGSYPFVTSSSTISGGACTGLGIAPKYIRKVTGIFKAYSTRVGGGPFPTELHDATGAFLREKGNEFGATTGRPRRTGWLDIPALKYAVMLSGVDELVMMKSDVLSGMETIQAGIGYEGCESDELCPFNVQGATVVPRYKSFPGWSEDISVIKAWEALPVSFKEYIRYLEDAVATPIKILSVGPDRTQTIIRQL